MTEPPRINPIRDRRTQYIRSVQKRGVVFVCPQKDRRLYADELACEDCGCISAKTKDVLP